MPKRRTVVVRLPAWLPEPSPLQRRRIQEEAQRTPAVIRPRTLPSPTQIPIELDQRWAILGASETGKTTFAKELIQQYRHFRPWAPIYVLDTKGRDFGSWPGRVRSAQPPDPKQVEGGFQIWEPPTIRIDSKLTDEWLDGILNLPGAAIVLIDELSNTTRVSRPDAYPAGLEVLQKTGRGLQKCMVTLTQTVAKGPSTVFSQATHLVRFGLEWEYDQRVADRLLGFSDPGKGLHEPRNLHGFWWCRVLARPKSPFEYEGFREFFGR